MKVHVGGDVVHTGQLFFRDSFTDAVYRRAPYRARGTRDMRNADDSIFRDGGSRSLLAHAHAGKGYVGSISWACAGASCTWASRAGCRPGGTRRRARADA